MSEFSEADAQRIADRGRDALLERLRPAFRETARRHADVLQLEDEQLEEMIERAADRADGLQWRRALAAVATEELGMSLGEALTAPVVARAQELVGAPSYEEALAALGLEPAVAAPPADGPAPDDEPAPEDDPIEVETVEGPEDLEAGDEDAKEDSGEFAPEAEEDSDEFAPDPEEDSGEFAPDPEEDSDEFAPEAEEDSDEFEPVSEDAPPETLRLAAIHLGGIATLEAGESKLELRIGAPGLDIARRGGRVLGRLRWREIRALEATPPRGLRRRRRQDRAQLVVRTQHGDATFEVPELGSEELAAQLAPLLERYARR